MSNSWSGVCGHLFDSNDAFVACRQLGYVGVEEMVGEEVYGSGVVQVLVGDVECTGNEDRLIDCSIVKGGDHGCSISDIVALRCCKYILCACTLCFLILYL